MSPTPSGSTSAVSGELTFAKGQSEKTVTLKAKDDAIPEPDERAVFEATTASDHDDNAYRIDGSLFSTFKVLDNEWHWVTQTVDSNVPNNLREIFDGDGMNDEWEGRFRTQAYINANDTIAKIDVSAWSHYIKHTPGADLVRETMEYVAFRYNRFEYSLNHTTGVITLVDISGGGPAKSGPAAAELQPWDRTIDNTTEGEHKVTNVFELRIGCAGTYSTEFTGDWGLDYIGSVHAQITFGQEFEFGRNETYWKTVTLVARKGNQ